MQIGRMRSVRSKHLEDFLQEIMLKLHVEGSGGFRLSRWKGVGFCEGIPPSKGGKMEMKWTSCVGKCEESMSCVEELVVGREWKSFGDLGQGQVLPKGGQWRVLRVSGSIPLWGVERGGHVPVGGMSELLYGERVEERMPITGIRFRWDQELWGLITLCRNKQGCIASFWTAKWHTNERSMLVYPSLAYRMVPKGLTGVSCGTVAVAPASQQGWEATRTKVWTGTVMDLRESGKNASGLWKLQLAISKIWFLSEGSSNLQAQVKISPLAARRK